MNQVYRKNAKQKESIPSIFFISMGLFSCFMFLFIRLHFSLQGAMKIIKCLNEIQRVRGSIVY